MELIMEITNLMLNDYVMIHCFDGSDIVIKVTRIEGEGGTVYGVSKKGSHWANIEDVKPIPLTSEILEKNGFVLNAKDEIYSKYVQVNEKEQYIITYRIYQNSIKEVKSLFRCELYFDGGINKIHNCFINYVHELQHALKVCNIRKEIVL